MTCQDALDRMMEADPAALAGGPTTDATLAEHLRECGRCRAVAAALSRELAALDAGLGDLASWPTTAEEMQPRAAPAPVPRAWRWIPLAAAAALAALLLLARPGSPPPGSRAATGEAPVAGESRPTTVAVTLPADRGAAVMSTRNPKITVVWLYERSE